jgi:hypothetical protein
MQYTIPRGVSIKQQTDRTIEFIASHELPDRVGEVVKIAGLDLRAFTRNPVLLLGHRYDGGAAVAKVLNLRKIYIEGVPALMADAYFPDRPQSNAALADVQVGLLAAVSIGFRPLETGPPESPGQKGVTFTKAELLEISLVPVPACSTCLITRKEYAMRGSCRCDDIELTDEQVRALPHLVQQLLPGILRDAVQDAHDEIDPDDFRRNFPAVFAQTFSDIFPRMLADKVARDVDAACRRLRGRLD